MSASQEIADFECIVADGRLTGDALARARQTLGRLKSRRHRCEGFAIGDGNYSGCAIGDGEDPTKFGDDVCPVCNNTGLAAPMPA